MGGDGNSFEFLKKLLRKGLHFGIRKIEDERQTMLV